MLLCGFFKYYMLHVGGVAIFLSCGIHEYDLLSDPFTLSTLYGLKYYRT